MLMKEVAVKAYGKLNLSLNVTGFSDGYHELDTVVTTVNLSDDIIVRERKDDKILVSFEGRYGFIPKFQETTNAYKAADAFIKKFQVNGVDVIINRNIPIGGGMGGSSADISGTLKALKRLYKVKDDVKDIADKLGSDSGYLLSGGFSRLKGRGEIVEKISGSDDLFFVALFAKRGVNAKECYSLFDKMSDKIVPSDTEGVLKAVSEGDLKLLKECSRNMLMPPAVLLNEEISENMAILNELSPPFCGMTGSGSAVFAAFNDAEFARWAKDRIFKKRDKLAEILYPHDPEKPSFFDLIFQKDGKTYQ